MFVFILGLLSMYFTFQASLVRVATLSAPQLCVVTGYIMDCVGLEFHGGDYTAYNKINVLL